MSDPVLVDETPIQPLNVPSPRKTDRSDLETEARELEIRKLKAEVKKLEDQNMQRTRFSWIFVGLAGAWILGVFLVVICTAKQDNEFELSDLVLTTLLGVGTVHVLGPAYMFSKYLFGNNESSTLSS